MAALMKKQEMLQVLSRGYLQSLHATGTTSQMSPSVIRPGASIPPRHTGLPWQLLSNTRLRRT